VENNRNRGIFNSFRQKLYKQPVRQNLLHEAVGYWYCFITLTRLRYVRVFAVAIASVVVCNVRAPYSAGWNFRQCFYVISYPGHPLTSKFYGDHPRRGLNARGVAKYSDVGHVEGYILETVQQLMTNRNLCRRIQWYTLDPLWWSLIRVLSPQFGKPFISLKLMELGRSSLTRR